MARWPQQLLTVGFLLALFAVPVGQAAVDWWQGDAPQALELLEQRPSEEHLRAFEEALQEHSVFEQSMRPALQWARYVATGDLGPKATRGRDGWLFYTPGIRYLVEPYDPRRGASGTSPHDPVAVVADFSRQLTDRGIALLVVPVPGKASVYPDRLARGGARAGRTAPDVATHTGRFIGELQASGVQALDLRPILVAARAGGARDGEPLYMATDTHWSGAGIRVAAEAVAERARSMLGWPVSTAATRYRREPMRVQRRGDIPRMTQIPMQSWLFGTEGVGCDRVIERATGEPYRDEPSSDVLVLGDSFARIFQADEPGAAGFIANLAYELDAPLASIVNDGGASTLVRQQLSQTPELLRGKKLVIWELIERDIRFGLRGWQPIELP